MSSHQNHNLKLHQRTRRYVQQAGVSSHPWATELAKEADRLLATHPGQVLDELTRILEFTLIDRALVATGGRRVEAANLLGMGRNTISRKIREMDSMAAGHVLSPQGAEEQAADGVNPESAAATCIG